jgi:HAMP domain-containing protein
VEVSACSIDSDQGLGRIDSDLDIPDPKVGSRDEIGTLTESVGRMRTNLVMAMKMLGA